MDNKNRGTLKLPQDLSLRAKQSRGASYTNHLRTQKVKLKIQSLVQDCLQRGLPATAGNLERAGLSRGTFARHKDFIATLSSPGRQASATKLDQVIRDAITLCLQRGLEPKGGNLCKCGLNQSAYYKHRAHIDELVQLMTAAPNGSST